MPVIAMQRARADSEKSRSATLRELCDFFASVPALRMSTQECEAIAIAAIGENAEAEFLVGCLYDAADEAAHAAEWYFRAASHDYLPAMLQLFAMR